MNVYTSVQSFKHVPYMFLHIISYPYPCSQSFFHIFSRSSKHSVSYHISILKIPNKKQCFPHFRRCFPRFSHGFPMGFPTWMALRLTTTTPSRRSAVAPGGGWDCPGGRLHPDPQGAATHQGHPVFFWWLFLWEISLW